MNTIKQFTNEYRFLSNFYPCLIACEHGVYSSVEHAYQAAKTLIPAEREKIRKAPTPAVAKKLGRTVTIRKDWDEIKDQVMKGLVLIKFLLNSDLQKKLLDTGEAFIQEGNYWHDTYWGVDLATGKGCNKLGKILMEVRDYIRGKPK